MPLERNSRVPLHYDNFEVLFLPGSHDHGIGYLRILPVNVCLFER